MNTKDVLEKLDRIATLPQHPCDDARNLSALEIAKREAQSVRDVVAGIVNASDRVSANAHKKAGGGFWMIRNEDMEILRAALARRLEGQ
jgi:hypothetical protein